MRIMNNRNTLASAQFNIRRNADEQNKVLTDLCSWEHEMNLRETSIAAEDQSLTPDSQHLLSKSTTRIRNPSDSFALDNNCNSNENAAEQERQRGNEFFSSQNFQEAIRCYSKSILLEPISSLAFSNRGKFTSKRSTQFHLLLLLSKSHKLFLKHWLI
jgi:hypothetical protein